MGEARMKLTLPFPPSANRYWRNYRGVTVVSQEAKSFKAHVRLVTKRIQPQEGPLQWSAVAYFPNRRGDLSNRIKIVEDALNGIAWIDDSQVMALQIERAIDKDNPRIEIEVLPWTKT